MKRIRNVTKGLIILDSIYAILWGYLSINDLISNAESTRFAIHLICASLWLLAAIFNYIAFRKQKKQYKDNVE